MPWEKVADTPLGEMWGWAPDVAPTPTQTAPGGDMPAHDRLFCEQNITYPCLAKKPLGAEWLLTWAECNCDPDDDEVPGPVTATCSVCLNTLFAGLDAPDGAACNGCGLIYKPGRSMIADVQHL